MVNWRGDHLKAPQTVYIKKYSRYIVVFIFGMIAGSLIFLYMYGQTMDRILLENRHLISTNKKLTDEITAQEEDFDALHEQNEQKMVVQKIDILVLVDEQELDGFIQAEVIDQLREDLKALINMPVESFSETHTAVQRLIDGKTYRVNQEEFEVRLHSMVIYTTITFHISLHRVN